MVTRSAFAIGFAALAGPVFAGTMEAACLERGTWDTETCACMQNVADEALTSDRQELAADFFASRITSQQIAAKYGAAVAQDFLTSIANFMSESTMKCGAP